jgi:hypothetical protein
MSRHYIFIPVLLDHLNPNKQLIHEHLGSLVLLLCFSRKSFSIITSKDQGI